MNEELNGTPEQRIPLKEGQKHLGGTGFTSTIYVKDIVDAAVHPMLTFKSSDYETNSIVFYAGQGNEMMRISPDGFFWKGKLVENDKEIYLKVKEFFSTQIK
jgi:hypothetical protein